MALETLKKVKQIGGFDVSHISNSLGITRLHELNKSCFVVHVEEWNALYFKLQNGPIKEVGENGCQVDTIIEAAKIMLQGLNQKYPCRENGYAIDELNGALYWLQQRKKDRINRGVEGLSKM